MEASDPDGLDELKLIDRADDVQYQLDLSSSSGPNRSFARNFALADVFPNLPPERRELLIEVLVKNTKGQTATAQARVRLQEKDQ